MSSVEMISASLKDLGFEAKVAGKLVAKLSRFVDALLKWNKTFNLTAIRERDQIISLHILDSLSVCPYIKGSSIIDVGSGGGFPGIPLALCFPDKQFTLLDSNGKKTRFLQQMVIELGLKNCTIVQARVEDYQGSFDQVCNRAFASIINICEGCGHLLKQDGEILAMKGRLETEDLKALPAGFELKVVHDLDVASIEADRHLVVMKQQKH